MASRSLDDLRPNFRALVDLWLADCQSVDLQVLVYCTLRTNDEQDRLYAFGRTLPGRIVTNATAGNSAHNWGFALDFVPLLAGKPQWAAGNKYYMHAIAIAEARGLQSLAKGPFVEFAHLQMPNWRKLI